MTAVTDESVVPVRRRSRARAPRQNATGWAVTTLVLATVGLAVGVQSLATAGDVPGDFREGMISSLCYLVPYALAGAFLLRRRPDLPFGWLLSGAAAALAVSLVALGLSADALSSGSTASWPIWVAGIGSLQFIQIGVQGLINVRFPTGRIESRWGRVLEVLLVAGLVLVVLSGVLGTSIAKDLSPSLHRPVSNPLTGDGALAHLADGLQVTAPLIVLLGLVAGLRIVVLARRSHGVERLQLRWRALGVVFSLLLFPFAVVGMLPSATDFVDGAVFVATLLIPVLRYRLWDIDAVIRRSVAYGLVTIVLAAGYLAIAASVAALVSERAGIVSAAFVVALAFGPARLAGQRVVDRMFYGQRNEPYRAVNEVSRRLASVAEPGTVLPAAVTAVAGSLRLPYVAVERPDGVVVASYGEPGGVAAERWTLTYEGAPVGSLVASPRGGETSFGRRDHELLGDLARQLGAAVHAEALTADLLVSRQRLVNAREDERRRLRRDLHDGLGPLLTGLGLNVDAARARMSLAGRGSDDADVFLAHVKEASSRAIIDLRGIVYGLRPPALDDLGLVGAVRAHAQRLGEGGNLTVGVEADTLGELPAAVEVAAFRIAVESVSNAVRHASAESCRVRFEQSARWLRVEVLDDGPADGSWVAGVGLMGMRERVAELGGSLTAGPTPDGGAVCALLPLSAAESS
jgi:two-component system, NarL family, sensor kinase